MKQSTKTLIATVLTLVVVIAFIIGGLPEVAAFFVIIAVLLLCVTVAELDRERSNSRQYAEFKSELEHE